MCLSLNSRPRTLLQITPNHAAGSTETGCADPRKHTANTSQNYATGTHRNTLQMPSTAKLAASIPKTRFGCLLKSRMVLGELRNPLWIPKQGRKTKKCARMGGKLTFFGPTWRSLPVLSRSVARTSFRNEGQVRRGKPMSDLPCTQFCWWCLCAPLLVMANQSNSSVTV